MLNNMHAIGGYFSLELPYEAAYHSDKAMKLNTGRNCLEYILMNRHYKKVYIPYYTCDAVFEPFEKLGVKYDFYHINQSFEIDNNITLNSDEGLIYTNYWGINNHHVAYYAKKYGSRLIVDNTQAFFDKHIDGIDTFYSCRKFFGVPDGAYLYTDANCSEDIPISYSYDLTLYLLKRIDLSPEAAYDDFHKTEHRLSNLPIRKMSAFTDRMMHSINYSECIEKRIRNFNLLHDSLGSSNQLHILLSDKIIPMVYPYLTDNKTLRDSLINNRIFVPKYWPNVEKWCNNSEMEVYLTNHILPLPIDQRYGVEDMLYIINVIKRSL